MKVIYVKHLAGQHNQATHGQGGSFKDINDYDHRAVNPAHPYYKINAGAKFDGLELEALERYTGSGSTPINRHLRGKEGYEYPSNRDIDAMAGLESAFSKCHTKDDINVYRGISGTRTVSQIKAGVKEKGTDFSFTDKGYTSTSTSKDEGTMWAVDEESSGVLMRIRVPKGSKAIALSPYSQYPDEREVLLNRNGLYKFHSIDNDGTYVFDYIEG